MASPEFPHQSRNERPLPPSQDRARNSGPFLRQHRRQPPDGPVPALQVTSPRK